MMPEHDPERDLFYRDAIEGCAGPLQGVRVLDVTTTWAGPRCSGVLADYGAEVIKIELRDPPEVARRLPPMLPDTDPPESYFNATVNRNKKNLCLDLRKPEGREVLLRLGETADVFVENFKKGTLASWNCGYKDLCSVKPEIIYVSITGFGQYGPYSHLPGYDPTAQAMSGFMHLNAQDDEAMPLKAPTFLADEIAGHHGAMAAMAALLYRQKTGTGQHVDVSLLDAMIDSPLRTPIAVPTAGSTPARSSIPTGSESPAWSVAPSWPSIRTTPRSPLASPAETRWTGSSLIGARSTPARK
jgi:formyl-CoA transferase